MKRFSFALALALPLFFSFGCSSPKSPTDQQSSIMSYNDIVHQRFSCKQFNPQQQVRPEALQAILEAGRVAPTAKNLQEQRIYVLSEPDILAQLDSITPCRYGAPTVIAVAYDSSQVFTYPDSQRHSGVEDATIVATHMLLAATANGVNSCWINFFNPDRLERMLNLPPNEKVVMLLDLGYAAPDAAPLPNHSSRKPLSATVTFGIHK